MARLLNLRRGLVALVIVAASQTAFAATGCDTCPLWQDIATSAYLVHLDVSAAESALLETGDPTVRAAFSILNALDAKAREINTVALVALGQFTYTGHDIGGQDIEAIAFLVLMEASKSAQDDLKTIMDGVKAINASKQSLRVLVNALQTSPTVADSITTLINDTVRLVTLFGPGCLDCDGV